MLKNDDIYQEIEAMEKVRDGIKDSTEKANLKAQILIIKLLHNIRTNMVTVMRHMGIKLVDSNRQKAGEDIASNTTANKPVTK